MKALVYEGAWQMPLRDIPKPEAGAGEVLIKVEMVGICGSDVHGYTGITGRRKPPIVMGHEFSGTIQSVGPEVKGYHVGDRVIVNPLLTCGTCDNCLGGFPNQCQNRGGLGMNMNGAYAEYLAVPEKMLYRLPNEMTFEQGAFVEPLAVGMHSVNMMPTKLLDTVVILGAGTIGLVTLITARMKGAGKIIITDIDERRLQFALKLGADVIINASKVDAVEAVKANTNGKGAPAVFEAVGITASTKQTLLMARNGGSIIWIGNSEPEVTINMQQIVTRELTIRGAYGFNEEFRQAIEAIRSKRIDPTALIEKHAPLEEGGRIIDDLAKRKEDWVKVMLKP